MIVATGPVYYQDDRVRIMRSELDLDGTKYRIAGIRAVAIETMPVYVSTVPGWAAKVTEVAAIVVLVGLGAFVLNLLVNFQPFRDILQTFGWPVIGFVAVGWLLLDLTRLFRRVQVAEVPVLRFRRYGWAGADVWFASMDRAYLRNLVAVMREVLRDVVPPPLTIDPPTLVITEQAVRFNDQSYALPEIQSASYQESQHKYVLWASIVYNMALVFMAVARILPERDVGGVILGVSLVLLLSTGFVSAIIRERRPSVYVLALHGSFGTVYPYASTKVTQVSLLLKTIGKRLQEIRSIS